MTSARGERAFPAPGKAVASGGLIQFPLVLDAITLQPGQLLSAGQSPALVLIDVDQDLVNLPAMVLRIRSLHPNTGILLFGSASQLSRSEVLTAGAHGYLRREPALPAENSLSARELQILRLIADGRPNKEIAALLNLADHTIKSHIRRITQRIQARDRAHAVAIGYRSGHL